MVTVNLFIDILRLKIVMSFVNVVLIRIPPNSGMSYAIMIDMQTPIWIAGEIFTQVHALSVEKSLIHFAINHFKNTFMADKSEQMFV
jgi:hypothetical protein